MQNREISEHIWNLSLLAPATTQLLVVTDTHFILPDNAQSAEWTSVREFPERTSRALKLAAGLPRDAAIHLGDISHEYPETGRADIAQQGAIDQFASLGLDFRQAAGNMDIGDKPDPTSPAQWVTPETLSSWHAQCGRSWHSFDTGEFHGIVLNTQIMNGPLPESAEQQVWVEADLQANENKRQLLFLHMPIYYVDREEHSTGFYNSLDEAARSWLLGLIGRFQIEHVFSGHTHTVQLNRHGSARLWTCPSTATSRAGLAEAYAIVGPDRGRGDVDKLGFYFVRETSHGMSVHLVRTGRETPALGQNDNRRLVMTRTSRDLPNSRVGIFATHPLGHANPGPVIWPSIVRQPVRDDFRLMSILEMGSRCVRVPASDLTTSSEADRLALLRDETVHVEPYWVWNDHLDLVATSNAVANQIDLVEVVLPGMTLPSVELLNQVGEIRTRGTPVKMSAAIVDSGADGQYHQRTRIGFHLSEIRSLDAQLHQHGATIDRAACRLNRVEPFSDQVREATEETLRSITSLDWYLDFASVDDGENARLAAEAVVVIAAQPGARIIIGPHVDFDRSMDESRGLIDRLSNSTPSFNVVRMLNSLLFREEETLISTADSGLPGIQGKNWHLSLIRDAKDKELLLASTAFAASTQYDVFDLSACLSEAVTSSDELSAALQRLPGPGALVSRKG